MSRIYTIYDRTAEEAGPLFEAPNDGVALRNFRNLMEKVPGYQRSDYRLYNVGVWNTHTMEAELCEKPEEIIYEEKE